MRIALSGTHSTGKTTLLNELKKQNKLSDYIFVDEITRKIQKKGLKINEQGDDETQLHVMQSHIDSLKYNDCILDRCVLDGIVYTHYLYNNNTVSQHVFEKSLEIFKQHKDSYDYIFFLKPEFPIEKDNVRSTNISFQMDVHNLFLDYIFDYNISVIEITGSIKDRINKVMEKING